MTCGSLVGPSCGNRLFVVTPSHPSNSHPISISTINSHPFYLKLLPSRLQTLVISCRYYMDQAKNNCWEGKNYASWGQNSEGRRLCSNMTRSWGAYGEIAKIMEPKGQAFEGRGHNARGWSETTRWSCLATIIT